GSTLNAILQRLEQTPIAAPRRVRRSVIVPATRLKEARALVGAGQSRDAYSILAGSGELKDFAGAEAQLVAGDVAEDLGADRLSRFLHFRAWRSAPSS